MYNKATCLLVITDDSVTNAALLDSCSCLVSMSCYKCANGFRSVKKSCAQLELVRFLGDTAEGIRILEN